MQDHEILAVSQMLEKQEDGFDLFLPEGEKMEATVANGD
jgi:hypothetical protein